MKQVEKTVFISYRRTNAPWALAIFQNLTQHGFDVFFDFHGVASGDFESVILANIKARAHFIVLLTPSSLDRCDEPGDWLRREIELALDTQRNVVPVMLEGFDFSTPALANHLTGKLSGLSRYNALRVPADYFAEAMTRLREKYLDVELDAVLHPASEEARRAARDEQAAAIAAKRVEARELTALEWFEKGKDATDPDDKLRFYSESVRLEPGNATFLACRGFAQHLRGDLTAALADYDLSVQLNPRDAVTVSNRGIIRTELGELEAALRDFDDAIRIDPNYAKAYMQRGALLCENGDTESGFRDLDEAIRLNPDFAGAYNSRGIARSELGDLQAAIKDFNEAIRLQPDFADPYVNRGLAHRKDDNHEAALRDYDEAIRISPNDPAAYVNRGWIHEIHHRHPEAISDYRKYLDLGGTRQDQIGKRLSDLEKRTKT